MSFLEMKSPGQTRYSLQAQGLWIALTDAATIATNQALGNFFYVTLGASRTMGAPTNSPTTAVPYIGRLIYRIRQGGTGTNTITWNAVFRFPSATAPTLSTTVGTTDYVEFVWNEIDSTYDMLGFTPELG